MSQKKEEGGFIPIPNINVHGNEKKNTMEIDNAKLEMFDRSNI